MDINGTTRVCGLIGNPVAHSISPVIHNRLAGLRGDNLVYATLRLKPVNVAAAVKGAYALVFWALMLQFRNNSCYIGTC